MQFRQKRRLGHYLKIMLMTVVVAGSGTGTAIATTSSSSNYQVTETEINSGTLDACSGQYCARASIGDAASGESRNVSTKANFGSVTEGEPLLEVIVEPGVSNLGELSTETTATKTTVIKVRNYMSGGYTLQINGASPVYDGHTLTSLLTPTFSTPGTEQFGINAVANTTPNVGANTVQVPSDQTSFGTVRSDYNIPNKFKYIPGDIVASSNTESGRTDYTISMIVNISNSTPAGRYSGDYSVIVVPVF